MDPKILDELARTLANSVPDGVKVLGEDVQQNFHAVLQSAFSRFELVTREEFEAQAAVLARTRQKVEALEGAVAELEATLSAKSAGGRDEGASAT